MRAIKISLLIVIISVCQTSAVLCSNAYGQTEKNIPEEKIAELREGLASIEDVSSTSQMRRELKRVSRSGMSLIRRYRKAETRFEVLAIVFECQKQMFILHDSDRNRKELLVICKMLVEAPDKYADLRMPADALLMQINLDQNNAGKQQRLTELAKFADRYRDTTAEIDSLILASEVTFNLGSKKLLTVFRRTLTEQFSHDPQVIAFMKQRFSVESPFQLRGIFKDATGKQRSFPIGQTYVVCFWSEDAPILEMKFAEIKELQDKYKGEFTVISFNLDELDDAGESILRKQGLDWVAMHLPDGAESELFASTGGANMFSIKVVGPHGLTRPEYKDMSKVVTVQPVSLDRKYRDTVVEQKYFPIIRSLGAGDFLIHESTIPAKTSIPRDTLNQIQACFEVSPDRYKLKADESFKNYQQAEKLCSDAIKKHAGADDLWVVYNRHIIASMGMWRITGHTEHLDRGLKTAKTVLGMNLPNKSKVVAHFCTAMRKLLDTDIDPKGTLRDFDNALCGEDADGSAIAAALILSVEAHLNNEYYKYRDLLLTKYANDPAAWPVNSLLLDQRCALFMFEKTLDITNKTIDKKIANDRVFKATFTKLDGTKVTLPDDTKGKLTFIVLMDGRKSIHMSSNPFNALNRRPYDDVNMIGVYRADDPNDIADQIKKYKWSFDADHAYASESQWQSLCHQFGITGIDLPKLYMIGPDGVVMSAVSVIDSHTAKTPLFSRANREMLRDHDRAIAEEALAKKDYLKFADYLSTSPPLGNTKRRRGEIRSLETDDHKRKTAWGYMQAEKWDKAANAFSRISEDGNNLGQRKKYGRRMQQDLYHFKHEHNLMMRAEIDEKRGRGRGRNPGAFRKQAKALAHPCPVQEYHPDFTREFCIKRRELARKHLTSGKWKEAVALLTKNIEVHETEPARCNSVCIICGIHVEALLYHAEGLKETGQPEKAEELLKMAKAAKCPTKHVRHNFTYFPIGRFRGQDSNYKLNYTYETMRGSMHCNKMHYRYRMELVVDLMMRARALEKLEQTEKSKTDRQRATALAFPKEPSEDVESFFDTNIEVMKLPSTYIEVITGPSDQNRVLNENP